MTGALVSYTDILHGKIYLFDFLLNVHGKQLSSCWEGQLS